MKRTIFSFLIAAAIFSFIPQETIAAPHPSFSGHSIHFGFFYSSLRPHGEWIELEDGFYAWKPFRVRRSWRPYQLGRWEWTNQGWYWMSSEPFGWVVFHYGRWYYDDYYGWVWIPGDEWAPAWVEWRYDSDYIGWAPLPPYAGFHFSIGIQFTRTWNAPVRYWNFVRMRSFGGDITYRDYVSEEHSRRLIRTTRASHDYEYRDSRIVNRGIDPTFIESRTRRRFEQIQVGERQNGEGERLVRSSGNQRTNRIEVYRPQDTAPRATPERIEARRGERRTSLEMQNIERRPDQTTPDAKPETPQNAPSRERPRNERSTPQIERTPQNQPETKGTEREVRSREQEKPQSAPQVTKPKEEKPTRERRKDLIERYDRSTPTPPTKREIPSVRRESSPQSNSAPASRQSGSERTNRRRD